MHKTFAAVRAIAALALVLAMIAGLFNTQGISAQESTPAAEPTTEATVEAPVEPTEAPAESVAPVETAAPVETTEPESGADAVDGPAGDDSGTETGDQGDSGDTFEIATEAIELRARVQEGQGNVGDTIFVVSSDVTADAIGDSTPLSGGTFQVVTNQDNTVIDEVTTGDSGLVFLDIPLGVGFRIIDTSTNDQSESFNFSRQDVQNGRPVVTATRIVEFGGTDVPSEGPTGDEFLFPVAVEQIELRVRTQEVAGGDSGTTIILGNDATGPLEEDVTTQQVDDSAPAALTFRVVTLNGDIIDEDTSGANGILLLDAPLTIPFFIQDVETLDASNAITLDETDVQAGRVLATATRFIAVQPGQNEGPTGDILPFAVAADQVELRARFQQNPNRDGETLYVSSGVGDGVTDADFANGESIPAAGVTFTVLSEDNLVVDQATTDADGIVLLDVPIDEDDVEGVEDTYTVIDSFNNDESQAFLAPLPSEVQEGRQILTATLFTDDLDVVAPSDIAIPSDEASASAGASEEASASAGTSDEASASAEASDSAAASASAAASNSDNASGSGSASVAPTAASSAAASGTGGATALPNTGAGDSGTGSSMTWALFALLAVVGVAAAGFGLRRRNV